METNQGYRIVQLGKKAQRRDYSKVSGTLDLPDLVEVQTASYEWLCKRSEERRVGKECRL